MFFKFLVLLLFKIDLEECPYEGIFSIPNTGCKSYKICSQLGASNYSCPSTTLFDQRSQQCVLDLICPDTTICAYSPPGLYPDPNYPSNNKFYIECLVGFGGFGVGNVMVRYKECSDGKVFLSNGLTGSCEYQGITATSSIPSDTTAIETTMLPSSLSSCQKEGFFPVNYSNCRDYKFCFKSGNNFEFLEENYQCPRLTYFNPWKNECLNDYICLENYCWNQLEGVFYLDPNDPDQKRYYECVWNDFNVLPLYHFCGIDEYFDQIEKKCVTTSTTSTTTITTSTTLSPLTSNCSVQGIYPTILTNCKEYETCTKFGNDFIHKIYRCPIMTYFDPWTSSCRPDYKCLEDYCLTQSENTFYPDPNDPDKKRFYQCVRDENGNLQLHYACGVNEVFDIELKCIETSNTKCSEEGIFEVAHTECHQYQVCSKSHVLNNNETSFLFRTITCPILTLFDPWKKQCLFDYECIDIVCRHQNGNVFYLDPNDSEKRRYYECIWKEINSYDTVTPFFYSCEEDEIFDETEQSCIKNHTLTSSIFSRLTPLTSDCYQEGLFPVHYTDCKTYKNCYKISTSFIEQKYVCPKLTFFDPWKKECVFDYECLENTCLNQPEGMLYLDPNDSDRKRYYECILNGSGMLPFYYSCKDGEVFDDAKKVCVENVGFMRWMWSGFKRFIGME